MLNDKITSFLKSDTVTVSPNSSGVVSVSLSGASVIIGASDDEHIFVPFYFNSGWKLQMRNYNNWSVVSSGTYSVTVYGI